MNARRELVIGKIPFEADSGMSRRRSLARFFQRAVAEHCPAHLGPAAFRRLDNDFGPLQADETAEEQNLQRRIRRFFGHWRRGEQPFLRPEGDHPDFVGGPI